MSELLNFFIKGAIAGFLIAAPTGPVGALSIKKNVNGRAIRGFLTGLGSVTADIFYAIVAAFGVKLISDFIISQKNTLQLVGGIFLIAIGTYNYLSNKKPEIDKIKSKSLSKDYLTGLLITGINPMTTISFLAAYSIIGGFDLPLVPFFVVLGTVFGAVFSVGLVNWTVSKMKVHFGEKTKNIIGRVSGVIIMVCGLALLLKLALY